MEVQMDPNKTSNDLNDDFTELFSTDVFCRDAGKNGDGRRRVLAAVSVISAAAGHGVVDATFSRPGIFARYANVRQRTVLG